MPFFLTGIMVSALVDFLIVRFPDKFSRNASVFFFIIIPITIVAPLAKGGIIPLVDYLQKKGWPRFVIVFLILLTPIINWTNIFWIGKVFGWGKTVAAFISLGLVATLLVSFLFWLSQVKSKQFPLTVEASIEERPLINQISFIGSITKSFLHWVPYLILGCLITAGLNTILPMTTWMEEVSSPASQILFSMGYSMLVSDSPCAESLIAFSWMGKYLFSSILAFLLSGALLDIRSLAMMAKAMGIKMTLYIYSITFLLILTGCLSWQLFF